MQLLQLSFGFVLLIRSVAVARWRGGTVAVAAAAATSAAAAAAALRLLVFVLATRALTLGLEVRAEDLGVSEFDAESPG